MCIRDSSKPCKWGLKAWALADSESYYLLDFNIYTGKKATNARLGSMTQQVVTDLVEPLYNKHHHVYFDKFFTSVSLLEKLLKNKAYACGTARRGRRGLPDPQEVQAG